MGHSCALTFVVPLLVLLAWGSRIASADTELDQITMDILHDLGLSRIPDVSKANISQEEYETKTKMYLERVAAHEQEEERDDEDDERDPKKSLLTIYNAGGGKHGHDGRTSRGRRSHGSPVRLRYPLRVPQGADVEKATLRMLVHDVAGSHDDNTVSVFEQVGNVRRLIGQRTPADPTWIEMDVTDAVKRALWGVRGVPRRYLTVHLVCAGCSSPALNLLVAEDGLKRRVKRAVANKRRTAACARQKQRCCRHEMEVHFKTLPGLEFVQAPTSFDAGYCKGRCPPRFNPANEHAILQWLVRNQNHEKVPKPCCAPAKLKALDILHVDENDPTKLKLDTWKNMRVVECACS